MPNSSVKVTTGNAITQFSPHASHSIASDEAHWGGGPSRGDGSRIYAVGGACKPLGRLLGRNRLTWLHLKHCVKREQNEPMSSDGAPDAEWLPPPLEPKDFG